MIECPNPQKIAAYLLDELDASENHAIAAHVDECTQCEEVMDGLCEDLALGEVGEETIQSTAKRKPAKSHENTHEPLGPSLLFGLLALHNSFVTRTQLVNATSEWLDDKSRTLPEIFVEQNAINVEDRHLIELLVQRHLESNGNDIERSLAGLGSSAVLKSELSELNDPDVEESLSWLTTVESKSATARTAGSTRQHHSERERFKKLRSHAQGGLGQIFVAVDQQLDRNVALKRIQPRLADNQFARLRFEQEAEVTGKLEHPGVVPVYALGADENGQPFYAMRFIKGQTLKDEIAEFHDKHARDSWRIGPARLKLHHLIGQLIDVCNTIEYAHHRGILHRDLKPDNVMLGKFGETIVVDWGLAKIAGSNVPLPAADPDESIIKPDERSESTPTTYGTIIGTLGYMSPEQAAGANDDIGPASDVYGLGAILYRLLTNQTSQSIEAGKATALRKIETGDFAAPRTLNSNIPAALESICLKAMATKPEDRYQSSEQMAQELEHWLAEESVSAHRETMAETAFRLMRRYRGLFMVGLATMSAIAAALIAAYALREASIARAAERKAANDVGVVRDLAKSTVDGWLSGPAADLRDVPGMDNFRQHLLESAAGAFDKLAHDQTHDPQLELDRARTRMKLGEGQLDLGNLTQAEQSFSAAKTILNAQLLQGSKLKVDAQFEATNCDLFLSQLKRTRGDEDAESLDAVIDKYRAFVASQPENSQFSQAYGAALLQRADERIVAERFADAEKDANIAMEQFEVAIESVASLEPDSLNSSSLDSSSLLNDLSEARSLFGHALLRQGKLSDAETYFTNAVNGLQVNGSRPQRDVIESRADARSYLAQVHRVNGRRTRELHETRSRISDYGMLCEQFPGVVRYQESLARSKMDEGHVLLLLGKVKSAHQSLTESSQRFMELQTAHPFRRNLATALASSLDGLAVSHSLLAQFDPASMYVEQAINIFNKENDPARLATCLGHHAEILEQQNRPEEASEAYRQAASLLVAQVSAPQASPQQVTDVKRQLAFVFTAFGSMLHESSDAEAGDVLATAKEYWSNISNASPSNQNEFARFLVSCPNESLRDGVLAETIADAATLVSPENADFIATLGAAHYRNKRFEKSMEQLDKAIRLRGESHAFELFYRAMSLAKLDRTDEAETALEAGSKWFSEEMPGSAPLRRLQNEAKETVESLSH